MIIKNNDHFIKLLMYSALIGDVFTFKSCCKYLEKNPDIKFKDKIVNLEEYRYKKLSYTFGRFSNMKFDFVIMNKKRFNLSRNWKEKLGCVFEHNHNHMFVCSKDGDGWGCSKKIIIYLFETCKFVRN